MYAADVKEMEVDMGKVVVVWEEVKEEEVEETKKIWERTFDEPYEKAGGAAFGGAAKVKPRFTGRLWMMMLTQDTSQCCPGSCWR